MRKTDRASSLLALVLAACASPAAADPGYSWQEPHARVLPRGDLEWAPRAFVFEKGESIRYIDFETGDDANPGDSRERPWKHHPWDPNATGNAKEAGGIHTCVFKRGVEYRGTLVSRDSGKPGNPIRLTSDPTWGRSGAALQASERITGWKRLPPGRIESRGAFCYNRACPVNQSERV